MTRLVLAFAVATAADALLTAPAESQPESTERRRPVAILISGMYDRLLVNPLVENLVRANVEAGTAVDTYFSMKPPSEEQNYAANKGESKWLVTEDAATKYVVDPQIAKAIASKGSEAELFDKLCQWTKKAGATNCRSEPEMEDPLDLPNDEAHQKIMSYYNPLSTESGQSVLKRWRTIEKLWGQAKEMEQSNGFKYNSVLLVRDDDYWLSPYIFDTADFEAHPRSLRSISCLEAHGINDKMLHIGRQAADKVVMTYQAWKEIPHEALQSTRNAEEFLFKLAMLRGVGLRPKGFNYALGTGTVSGIPCFRKQSFNLTDRGGYQKCHDEANENGPITKLFRTFSCDAMNPAYYEAVGKEDVAVIKEAVGEAAFGDEQKAIVFTIADSGSVDSALQTVQSLQRSTSGNNKAVIVVKEQHVCDKIKEQSEVAVCAVVSASTDGLKELTSSGFNKAKLALLTLAINSHAARGVLYAEPGVEFEEGVMAAFQAAGQGQDIIFAPSHSESERCAEMNEGSEVSSDLFYVKATPGGVHALMRSWMFLVEGSLPGGLYAGETVSSLIDFDLNGRSLKVGEVGKVRGVSHKDPERVVIDFDAFVGLALLPKQLKVKGPSSVLFRASRASTGVRHAATPCSRIGWKRLPQKTE